MSRAARVLTITVLVCGPIMAQDGRLGDVAGSITLDPNAVVEKQGVVEDPRTALKADSDLLGEILAGCSARADRLDELINEARETFLTEDSDIPVRLRDSSLELETAIREIELLRLTGILSEPLTAARRAAEVCDETTRSVRTELARGGIAFREANEKVARCRGLLDDAAALLADATTTDEAAGNGAAEEEQESPRTAATSPDDVIAELCEARRSEGEAAVEDCRGRQYRALAAIESRTAEYEMLDELSFAGVRSLCATVHLRDFVARNECEIEKMTALRLELE